ncbi:MAG: MFS transporter [Actinomycetota bacterium]
MAIGLAPVWRERNLRNLVIARFVSNFGNGLAPIAISFGVLGLPNGDGRMLSLVMFANMLPLVLFTLVGGVIGDRFPRAALVGSTDVLLGILVVANGFSLIIGHGSVIIFVLTGFFGGILNAIWYPAMSALTSDLADPKILQESNSAIMLSSNIALIIGTSTGGILVATLGAGWAILLDGITFIIAGLIVFAMRSATPVATKTDSTSTFHELRTGWREFSSRTWVIVVVIAFSFVVAMERAVYSVIGPLVADKQLGGPKPWSVILAAWAVGSVVGVLFAAKLRPKYPIKFAVITQLPVVLWFFSLGNTKNIFLIAAIAFVVGIVFDFFYVIWVTTLQQHIPKESLSKVMAYDVLGSLALAPLGIAIAGPLAEEFGSKIVLDWITAFALIALLAPLAFRDVRLTTSKSN